MTSDYAALVGRLAPDHDAAHVEAWMRLKHPMLDAISALDFELEVASAIECIDDAGVAESDELARSLGLQSSFRIGEHVLVTRDGGLPPAAAEITGENEHRPHLVEVKYRGRRRGGWIARRRAGGSAPGTP